MGKSVVGILMGSKSDLPIMEGASEIFAELGVPHEMHVMSAHRSPHEVVEYASSAAERGLQVLIGGAGGAAHLPGVMAALTLLPVLGVPMPSRLDGLDSLLSIAQMPTGIPVGTLSVGGAKNAALLAAQILALHDEGLRLRVAAYRERRRQQSVEELPTQALMDSP